MFILRFHTKQRKRGKRKRNEKKKIRNVHEGKTGLFLSFTLPFPLSLALSFTATSLIRSHVKQLCKSRRYTELLD